MQLFGLQKGPRLEELKALGTNSLIIDASPLLDDFADTAALIQRLDLVLMTDSSVAHLTGALGCPIWVMLMHHPDWRWLKERTDSPWYPSVRLFRQQTPRDWEHVFAEVERELTALAANRPRRAATPAARPPQDLVVPSAFSGADGRPRFAMPIPARFQGDAGLRVLAREEAQDGGFEYASPPVPRRSSVARRPAGRRRRPLGHLCALGRHALAGRGAGAGDRGLPDQRRAAAPLGRPQPARGADRGGAGRSRDREGFASVAPQSTMGHHLTDLGQSREGGPEGGDGWRIPVTTIDRLLDDRPALQQRRTFVKIDVEGLEPEVVQGADRLLRSGRVTALIFEKGRNYNTPEGRPRLVELCRRLRELGFSLWRLPHENMGGPLVPLALTRDLCNVLALAPGFVQRRTTPSRSAPARRRSGCRGSPATTSWWPRPRP